MTKRKSRHMIMSADGSSTLARVIGKAIFLASIQWALGSVEMSSKFSVMNFSKDQDTLQRAADALRDYVMIGFVWALGTVLVLWSCYGSKGLWIGVIANLLVIGYIVMSYVKAFRYAATKNNLQMPKLWSLC